LTQLIDGMKLTDQISIGTIKIATFNPLAPEFPFKF